MKSSLFRALIFLGLAFAVGGCATYDTQLDKGRSLTGIKRFFVVSNLNDNHGIANQIVTALKTRGREADTGPLTMMPDDTQVIVSFQDHWTWDFSDHLVFLQLAVHDRRSEQAFVSVSFNAKIPLREETNITVARLVDRLLVK